jgi:hypothetical protein
MNMKKRIEISPKALLFVPLFLATACTGDLQGNYRNKTYFSEIGAYLTYPFFLSNEGCQFNHLSLNKDRVVGNNELDWLTDFYTCSEILNKFTILGNGVSINYNPYGLISVIKDISSMIEVEKDKIKKMELQNKMDNILDWFYPVVSVSSLPKEDSKENGNTVINLSNHGQEALIHEVANLSKTGGKSAKNDAAKNLFIDLSNAFKPEEQKGPVNLTVLDRWLYVTVKEPKILAPADRIVKTIVSISLQNLTIDKASPDYNKDQNEPKYIPARFVSWDKAVTAYEKIEQGEIKTELTNKAELTAKVAPPAAAPVEGSLEGTLSRQLTRSETLPIMKGSEQLTVNIECLKPQPENPSGNNKFSTIASSISSKPENNDEANRKSKSTQDKPSTLGNNNCDGDDGNGVLNTLSIYKRSVTGGQPLTGTTQVGVKIKLGNFNNSPDPKTRNIKAVSIDGVDKTNCKNSSAACLTERQDKLSFQDVTLVNPNFIKEPLRANLDINFVIRHVTSGWDTYEEGDDDIELIQFNDQRNKIFPIILLPSEIPKYYGIFTSNSPTSKPLVAKYDHAPDEDVRFICYESMADANKFIDFFRHITTQPSSYPHSSTYQLIPGLSVTTTVDYSNNIAIDQRIYSADGLVAKLGCGEQFEQKPRWDILQSMSKKPNRKNKARRSL